MYYYSVYGITVATEQYIAEMPLIPQPDHIDTYLYFWETPDLDWPEDPLFRSEAKWDDEQGRPYQSLTYSKDQQFVRLVYRDKIQFIISVDGNHLYVNGSNEVRADHFQGYLLGAGLGYTVRLKGTCLLHGSVVNVDNNALMIVGKSGLGKSTTATTISQLGYQLMNDDVAPLYYNHEQDLWYIAPGYPRMRLWGDASEALHSRETAEIMPNIPKYFVEIDQFETSPRPVCTIFILAGRSTEIVEPEIILLNQQDALMNLLPHAYFYNFYDNSMKADTFKTLGKLVGQIKCYTVIMPHDLAMIRQNVHHLLNLHRANC